MNVILTPHLKNFIKTKVRTGGYRDPSEVLREALRLLEKAEGREPSDLEELIAEADAEPSSPMTAADWALVRREVLGKRRKAA